MVYLRARESVIVIILLLLLKRAARVSYIICIKAELKSRPDPWTRRNKRESDKNGFYIRLLRNAAPIKSRKHFDSFG